MSPQKMKKKRVAVIGATGSVGSSVLSVCRAHADEIEVCGLAARTPAEPLLARAAQIEAEARTLEAEVITEVNKHIDS